jgi:hypothetical protein
VAKGVLFDGKIKVENLVTVFQLNSKLVSCNIMSLQSRGSRLSALFTP